MPGLRLRGNSRMAFAPEGGGAAPEDSMILKSAIEAIGRTPLVELERLAEKLDGRILAKLEYLNPGFSKKDRIARQIVEDAREAGELAPGQPVIELTSGNTGTGLAIVCAVLGHPFIAVMSRGNSEERARMMRAFGAEVVLVDQAPGSPPGQVSGADLALVNERTEALIRERGAFRADQFQHRGNFRAHYLHTGPEVLRQAGDLRIDAFCDFAGSGGTFAGCARAFKEADPSVRCYVIEPAGAPTLSGGEVTRGNHRIQGGGYAMELPLLNPADVDGYLTVTDEEATSTVRELARTEGIFGGFSSGANIAVARRLLREEHRGGVVVVMICDSGLKYLSTDLWE